MESEGPPQLDGKQAVRIRFLVPEAPHEWLAPGRRFSLWWDRLVAEAVAISRAIESRKPSLEEY